MQTINRQNYFQVIATQDINALPEALQNGHHYVVKTTHNGTNWKIYDLSEKIRRVIDSYFAKLSDFLSGKSGGKNSPKAFSKPKKTASPAKDNPKDLLWLLGKDQLADLQTGGPEIMDEVDTLLRELYEFYWMNPEKHKDWAFFKYSFGPTDWYVTYLNKKSGRMICYVVRKNDFSSVERHEMNFSTFNAIRGIDLDLHWPARNLKDLGIMSEEKFQKLKSNFKAKKGASTKKQSVSKSSPGKAKPAPKPSKNSQSQVNALSPDVQLLIRLYNMHGKVKTVRSLLNYLKALQKAILEKRIRKSSPYKSLLEKAQDALVNLWNDSLCKKDLSSEIKFMLPGPVAEKLQRLKNKFEVRASVRYLKRFIGMHGKPLPKTKAQRFLTLLQNAIGKRKVINARDPYRAEIDEAISEIKRHIQSGSKGCLHLPEQTLNGLEGVLNNCACEVQAPLNGVLENVILPTTEVRLRDRPRIALPASYRQVFGNLAEGFSALIWGPRGSGKSTFTIRLAHHLARVHGKVLYVSFEEGFDRTSFDLLDRLNLRHRNLIWADFLPEELSEFDTVVIDSITHGKLGIEQLKEIRNYTKRTGKNLILINQATQAGQSRGSAEIPHLVDVEVQVEDGEAETVKSRYGAGGRVRVEFG